MLTLSLPSVARATVQPPSTGPTTSSSGTKTSSKKTSLKSDEPVACLSGRTSTPGCSMSITIMVMPWCLGASGSVRTVARPRFATWARLVQTFWPVTSQPPSTRGGPRGDAGGVGPRVGLAEQLAPDDVVVECRADPAGDLVVGGVLDEGEDHPPGDAVGGLLELGRFELLLDHELLDGSGVASPTDGASAAPRSPRRSCGSSARPWGGRRPTRTKARTWSRIGSASGGRSTERARRTPDRVRSTVVTAERSVSTMAPMAAARRR